MAEQLLSSFKFFQAVEICAGRLAAAAKNKDEHENKKEKARGEHGDQRLNKRAATWTGNASTVNNCVVFGTCFAECGGVSFQTLSIGVAGDVQINAAIWAAAMNSFFGLIAAPGEFIVTRSWSPIPRFRHNLCE